MNLIDREGVLAYIQSEPQVIERIESVINYYLELDHEPIVKFFDIKKIRYAPGTDLMTDWATIEKISALIANTVKSLVLEALK